MKKVKYYYSQALHIRMMPVVTDAEGTPMYIPETKPVIIKPIPRVVVASVWNPVTNKITFGSAVCNPKDVFKKSVGRELALKRAVSFPEKTIILPSKSKIKNVSRKYADQLISQHLHKYVFSDI